MYHIVISGSSYLFIKSVADDIAKTIGQISESSVRVSFTEDVDSVHIRPGSIVLVIGENLPRFQRDSTCYYVYLNFSLLYRLRWYRPIGQEAVEWIGSKHSVFMSKLHCFDMVLDFYRQQSMVMQKQLCKKGIPVHHLQVGVLHDSLIAPVSVEECEWDVCVVGSMSKRRDVIFEELRKLGIKLSPITTDNFPLVASRSRIVLNIHYTDCDTFEIPRIIEALALGRCVVTEPCYGMRTLVPEGICQIARYRNVVSTVSNLLNHPDRIARSGAASAIFYSQVYNSMCKQSLERIMTDLQVRADFRLNAASGLGSP